MPSFRRALLRLSERSIAQDIGLAHDEARMLFRTERNTARDEREAQDIIANYVNHHHTRAIAHGGTLSRADALGLAREILSQHYRRQNGTADTALNDAVDGTNGGLRYVLDVLADGLKSQAIERHVAEIFDQEVAPSSWEDKVELIRQLMAECGHLLSSSIRRDQPERYAHNYQELIQSYVSGLQRTASVLRRL